MRKQQSWSFFSKLYLTFWQNQYGKNSIAQKSRRTRVLLQKIGRVDRQFQSRGPFIRKIAFYNLSWRSWLDVVYVISYNLLQTNGCFSHIFSSRRFGIYISFNHFLKIDEIFQQIISLVLCTQTKLIPSLFQDYMYPWNKNIQSHVDYLLPFHWPASWLALRRRL